MKALRVPGTTIAVTLLPGFVEIRDKGLVKKKIPVRNRSFEDVLEDLTIYFKAHGKRLPPGMLSETLIKIGVPRAKRIISQATTNEVTPPPEEKPEPAIPTPPLELSKRESSIPSEKTGPLEKKRETIGDRTVPEKETETEKTSIEVEPGKVNVLSEENLADIEAALTTVESMSDSFMAASSTEDRQSPSQSSISKPQIKISVSGSDKIEASDNSAASAPPPISQEPEVDTPVSQEDDAYQDDLIQEEAPSLDTIQKDSSSDLQPEGSPTPEDSISMEEIPEDSEDTIETGLEKLADLQPAAVEEEMKPESETQTPVHAVKPLVSAKAVILGEDGVGKHSLQEKAELRIEEYEEGINESYIRSGIFTLVDHRVNLKVWSFDDAAKLRISRKDFYRDVHVVIVVYAISDRWSFESIEFWLRESNVKNQDMPPIVIVGNKKDLRDAGDPDPLEPPVTTEEGFKMAEVLAKRFGEGEKLHPVAFIETSCLTGEGTMDVFKTASEFFVIHS